jgi:hypothetical protein
MASINRYGNTILESENSFKILSGWGQSRGLTSEIWKRRGVEIIFSNWFAVYPLSGDIAQNLMGNIIWGI